MRALAPHHLCGMLFMRAVDKEILAVPYKGNATRMNDLIAKQIDLTCDQTTQYHGADRLEAGQELRHHDQNPPRFDAGSSDRGRSRIEGF